MQKALTALSPYFYVALRVAAGLVFAQHGAQKLFGLLGGQAVALSSQRGLAGIIEFVGGILIALGLFTTPVAFIAPARWRGRFSAACSAGRVADPERRRACRSLLLHLSVSSAVGSGKLSIDSIRK